jgi:hypothetical protein
MTIEVEKVVEPKVLEKFQPIQMREITYNQYIPRENQIKGKYHHGSKVFKINGEEYPTPIRAWVNDIVKGLSPVLCFHGQRQSGKSTLVNYIMWELHNNIGVLAGNWNPETNLCYQVSPFIDRTLNYIREAIVVDEAGKLLKSSEWYTDYNKANDDSLETLGLLKHVNAYISTEHSDLDKGIRKRDKYKITPHPQKHEPHPDPQKGRYVFQVKEYKYDKQSETKKLLTGYPKKIGNIEAKPSKIPKQVKEAYRNKEFEFKHEEGRENYRVAKNIEERQAEEEAW